MKLKIDIGNSRYPMKLAIGYWKYKTSSEKCNSPHFDIGN